MGDLAEWTKLVLDEMRRFDQNHRDILKNLDKIKDEQINQGKTLVKNTASLQEHMRRTDLLEKKVETIKNAQEMHNKQQSQRITQVETPQKFLFNLREFVLSFAKLIGAAGTVTGFVYMLLRNLGKV